MDENDLISIRETAEMLDISVDTLRRWDESGRFPSIRNSPTGHRFYSKKESKVFDKIKKRYGLSDGELEMEFNLRTQLIYAMYKRGIFDFNEIQKIVNGYYKNPEATLKQFGLSSQPVQKEQPKNQERMRTPSETRKMQKKLGY